MLRLLRRYLRRRRLGPVVGTLPGLLNKSFGPGETYTPAQVRRCLERMRLGGEARAFAFAACCTEVDYLAELRGKTPADYARMRAELAALFDIWPAEFTCEHLRRLRHLPASSRWTPLTTTELTGMDGGGSH